jgi:hypothetical protein
MQIKLNKPCKPLKKKVVVPCVTTPIEFVSPIFIMPKKDGDVRLILNLKKLNESVENFHFKMENIHTALKLITKDCWMASLDLKDAYYSVPIHPESQNFLKFSYKGGLFKFTAFPNGLSSCPRKFTKLLKPILATLRLNGHIIVVYIDDLLLVGHTYEKCVNTIIDTLTLLERLGFVIHPLKSIFTPVQELNFLGFLINSHKMTICLTEEKKAKLLSLINNILTSNIIKIRCVAQVIGHMVSSFPAVEYGPLYYRKLDKAKNKALAIHKGNFEAPMSISSEAKVELNWWITNLPTSFKLILATPIDIVIYSDASKIGWGAALGNQSTGGNWCKQESECHINILEMRAALFALKSFVSFLSGKHVKIMVDNSTTVYVLNNMGTNHNDMLHNLAVEIWEFCRSYKIYITAAHLPGSTNIIADKESRHLYREGEWMLNPNLVSTAIKEFNFQPEIDLFASRLNKQLPKYCSFRPDPEATYIDAFSIPWSNLKFYRFPPFSCILQTIRKIQQEKATGILVVPHWPTQPWFPLLAPMLLQHPQICPPSHKLLQLPASPDETHPLMKNLELRICLVSGNNSQN